LRAHAHAASGALLVLGAGDGGTAGRGNAVEAGQPIRIESRTDGFAIRVENGEFGGKFLLAGGNARADDFNFRGKTLDFSPSLGERSLVSLGALKARVLIVFEPVSLGGRKLNLVFDGCGLLGCRDGVELLTEAGYFPAISIDFAFQARSERIFTAERRGDFGRMPLGGCQRSLGLRYLGRQYPHLLIKTGTVKFERLKLYEVFN
jgi:hypothetical protein